MQAAKTIKEQTAAARQFEQEGDVESAAAIYQQLVNDDPENQPAVARLLVMYRKLKDYRNELGVIDAVLAAYARRDKDLQVKWVKEHPKAAGVGRSILKQLGGSSVSAYGSNRAVNILQKRRELVQKRLGLRTGKEKKEPKSAKPLRIVKAAASKKTDVNVARARVKAAAEAKAAKQAEKAEAAAAKSAAAAAKAAAAAAKAAAETAKADAKAAKAAKAAETAKTAKAAAVRPSLFIISIRYLAALEKIDAAMPRHLAFLKKQYDKGLFIISGRQVPRTGGIIIARGRSREALESLMEGDPFIKNKLASIDIVEFTPSQVGKGWKKLLNPTT